MIAWIVCLSLVSGFVGNNIHPYRSISQSRSLPQDQSAQISQLWSTNSVNIDNDGRTIATTAIDNEDEESSRNKNMGAPFSTSTLLATVPVPTDMTGSASKGFFVRVSSVVTGVVSGSVRGTVQVVGTVASGVVGGTIGAVGAVGRLVGIGRAEERVSDVIQGSSPTTVDDLQSYEPKGFLGRTKRLIRRRLFNLWSRAPQRWTNAVSGDAGEVLTSAAVSKLPDKATRQRLEVDPSSHTPFDTPHTYPLTSSGTLSHTPSHASFNIHSLILLHIFDILSLNTPFKQTLNENTLKYILPPLNRPFSMATKATMVLSVRRIQDKGCAPQKAVTSRVVYLYKG